MRGTGGSSVPPMPATSGVAPRDPRRGVERMLFTGVPGPAGGAGGDGACARRSGPSFARAVNTASACDGVFAASGGRTAWVKQTGSEGVDDIAARTSLFGTGAMASCGGETGPTSAAIGGEAAAAAIDGF